MGELPNRLRLGLDELADADDRLPTRIAFAPWEMNDFEYMPFGIGEVKGLDSRSTSVPCWQRLRRRGSLLCCSM